MAGYDRLAEFQVSDKGLAIYRSFAHLNAKNLLHLQAEIVNLEYKLNKIIQADVDSGDPIKQQFQSSVLALETVSGESWTMVCDLRELLNKYNNALIQQSQLLQFKPPHPRDLTTFTRWINSQEGGNSVCSTEPEMRQWSGKNKSDLIALHARYENVDMFTRWVFSTIVPRFHRHLGQPWRGRDVETGQYAYTWYYDDNRIILWTRRISVFGTCVIPVFSVLFLVYVKSVPLRLSVIVIFNILFSLFLGVVGKAKQAEILAASFTFAAVQIAFMTSLPSTS